MNCVVKPYNHFHLLVIAVADWKFDFVLEKIKIKGKTFGIIW